MCIHQLCPVNNNFPLLLLTGKTSGFLLIPLDFWSSKCELFLALVCSLPKDRLRPHCLKNNGFLPGIESINNL
jgi:hypothetical protein